MEHRRYTEPKAVVNCYSLFDKWFPICGMLDYTEGMYHGDPATPYDVAQLNQINYVLDEVGCTSGTRILEIGCGNGALLEEVRRRGAAGVGVNISPEQVRLCRRKGLNVHQLNYRDLDDRWFGRFDAVVANGPIEHFVQPADAAAGKADNVYREMFAIAHRAIDPHSSERKFINTTIHFLRVPDPRDLLKSPLEFRRGSDRFHYSMLAHSFGGWYPVEGQLEQCAGDLFRMRKTIDGTYDYHLTSEHWLNTVREKLHTSVLWRIAGSSVPVALRHPLQVISMMACMLWSESWNWQFRGPDAPTRLLRQTWDYQPV